MAEKEYGARLAEFAISAGEVMIQNGAETHRVEDTLSRLLATTGFSYSAFVLPTGITVTLTDPSIQTVSLTRRIFPGGTDLGKIADVNTLSRALCSGAMTLGEANGKLEEIRSRNRYSYGWKMIGVMLGCAGFAVVFGGGTAEFLIGLLVGFFLSLETYLLRPLIRRSFITDAIGAALSTFLSILFSVLFTRVFGDGKTILLSAVIAGCIMPLVPGVAITNAIRDIFAGDYLSAASRAIEAFLIATSIAIGVGIGISGAKWMSLTNGINFEGGACRYEQCFAAFLAVLGFCLIFQVPKNKILPAGVGGGICWAVYVLGMSTWNLGLLWAVFLSSLAVDFYSQLCARVFKSPVTLYLITAIVLLVPGFHIYQAVYFLLEGDSTSSGAALSKTFLIAGAIALAVMVGDTVIGIIFRKKTLGEKVNAYRQKKKG